MGEKKEKLPLLETSLLTVMQALDNQVAREMQRDPATKDELGVSKWDPYQKRIENLCSFILNGLGEQEVGLDSVLILAQAFCKSLHFVIDDLGADGLGKIRSEYCKVAMQNILDDSHRGSQTLTSERELV